MVYLDYSANYPVKEEVLDYMKEIELSYIGNANSIHNSGIKSLNLYNELDNNIKSLLKLNENFEIVYTSSATESNNLAIKGLAKSYSGFGKHILVSPYEHSSVNGALATLKDEGFEIEFLKVDSLGMIDKSYLESKIRTDTILVIAMFVESEAGIINDCESIADIINNKNPNCHYLCDATQGIIKFDLDLNKLDLISFTPHKFGGLTGTGCLIKRKSTILTPLINGGKSSSIYRSGTIPLGLIGSIYKSIELAYKDLDKERIYVIKLHKYLIDNLKASNKVMINSFDNNPYIINISLSGIKASDSVKLLNDADIYVSQKSACSISNTPSKTIMAIYNNRSRALSSFRISISSLTTYNDIDKLINTIRSIVK